MSAKRIRFKNLSERLAEVDVNISRNIEYVKVTEGDDETGEGGGMEPEEMVDSYFGELARSWSQRNRTEDFADCMQELRPLSASLPMIVFNLGAIVDVLLKHAVKPDSMATEPALMLLGALARDVRAELMPHFRQIFT
ncbi:unnamed protein product, partial [Polarella glacialis]